MATVRVTIFKPELDRFRGWNGPVGRSTLRLARQTATAQKVLVGKKSGRLAASITVGNRTRWARGIEVKVGAGAGQRARPGGYALMNDQGTPPHPITPRKQGGMLIFYWAKVGRVVRFERVFHPGNRAYHWAERGMVAAMAIWQRTG